LADEEQMLKQAAMEFNTVITEYNKENDPYPG